MALCNRWTLMLAALMLSAASTTTSVSAYAFGVTQQRSPAKMMPATTVAPPETDRKTSRRTGRRGEEEDKREYTLDDVRREGPLEYLEDDMALRGEDDPFHILLLGSTFEKPKITVKYVSGSLSYVLDMPDDEAFELSTFAALNGMSCLGTWTRAESLRLGKQLQVRDIVCRVVPFCEGGQRGWQARGADSGDGVYDVPAFNDGGFS